MRFVLAFGLVIGCSFAAGPVSATTCNKYVTVTGAGSQDGSSWSNAWTLADANANASAGDVVCIEPDEYTTQLQPVNNGTSSSKITFVKDPAGSGDVVIRDVSKCVYINRLDPSGEVDGWIVVDGLTCDGNPGVTCDGTLPANGDDLDVLYGVHLIDVDSVEIRNMTIRHVESRGIEISSCNNSSNPDCDRENPDGSDHNWVHDNLIECTGHAPSSGRAIYVRAGSDDNLVEGNTIRWAAHHGIMVESSARNVILENVVDNPWWRALSATGPAPGTVTENHLHEWNVFDSNLAIRFGTETAPSYTADLGLSLHSNRTIVRRNRLIDGDPNAVSMSPGGSSAAWPDLSENRIYNNTFAGNGSRGFRITDQDNTSTDVSDNVIVNNVFFGNHVDPVSDPDGAPDETEIRVKIQASDPETQLSFENNLIRIADPVDVLDPEDDVIYANDHTGSNVYLPERTLDEVENAGSWFANNLEDVPQFVNRTDDDYRLMESSPLVDAGRFLTKVSSAGCSGTVVGVEDTGFFFEGLSQAPAILAGDTIQLEGSSTELVIQSIDRSGGTLTVDQSVTCAQGDGVALAYEGNGPDVGYHEGGVTETVFLSDDGRDGYVEESIPNPGEGGFVKSNGTGSLALRSGDGKGNKNLGIRSILAFDTSSLPSAAVVTGAFLVLESGGVDGDPVGVGDFLVEMVDGYFGPTNGLEKEDWEATADASFTVTGYDATGDGDVWVIDLGEIPGGLDLIDPDGWTQIRLRLDVDSDDDDTDDLFGFYSGDDTDKEPELRLTYETP